MAKPVLIRKLGVAAALLIAGLMVMVTASAGIAIQPSAAQTPIILGKAGDYVVFADAGISSTGTTSIVGDIGTSSDSTSITGNFALSYTSGATFATSVLVDGKIYANDFATPTPANVLTASGDMLTAYTSAGLRTPPISTDFNAGEMGAQSFAAGLYKWTIPVTISTNLTLSGSSTDVWIFQMAQTLIVNSDVHIILTGGAAARNIFWQVTGATTLGTGSVFKGIILCATSISMNTGASLEGRALAQTAVTLAANAITAPVAASIPPPAAISGFPVVIFICFLMLGITYSMISRRKNLKNATA